MKSRIASIVPTLVIGFVIIRSVTGRRVTGPCAAGIADPLHQRLTIAVSIMRNGLSSNVMVALGVVCDQWFRSGMKDETSIYEGDEVEINAPSRNES